MMKKLKLDTLDSAEIAIDTTGTCYFLDKLPIEIRNQIYGLLLINPDLAKKPVFDGCGLGSYPRPTYGLSPSILGVCHKFMRCHLLFYTDPTRSLSNVSDIVGHSNPLLIFTRMIATMLMMRFEDVQFTEPPERFDIG
jgi:hypothetical protein